MYRTMRVIEGMFNRMAPVAERVAGVLIVPVGVLSLIGFPVGVVGYWYCLFTGHEEAGEVFLLIMLACLPMFTLAMIRLGK